MRLSKLPFVVSAVVLLFFYLPIGVLCIQSFNAAKFGGSWKGFSFRWYQELWEREDIHNAAYNTLIIAFSSVLNELLGHILNDI